MPNKKLQKAIEREKAVIKQRGAYAGDLETVKGQIAALDASIGADDADISKLADELGSLETKKAALIKALESWDRKAELAGKVRHELQRDYDLAAAQDYFNKANDLLDKKAKVADELRALAADVRQMAGEGEKLVARHRRGAYDLGQLKGQYLGLVRTASHIENAVERIWDA